MPAHPLLTDAEIRTLADYVREIRRLGLVDQLTQETAEEGEEFTREEIEEIASERVTPSPAITLTRPGPAFRPDTEVGRKLYVASCASCHGRAGRGDGLDMPLDEQGKPITVRDLTSGKFRGGGEPEEIFKRIVCGIPGTPMPVQESMSDEEAWQVVHYVKFLAGRRR
jgi:high-affinity iron transporter